MALGRTGSRRAGILTAAFLPLLVLVGCGSATQGEHGASTPPDAAAPAGAQQPAGIGATNPTPPRATGTRSSNSGANPAAAPGAKATPYATRVPFATPQSPGGQATVHTVTAGDFTQTGSTCDASGGAALFEFGSPGSGEEVTVAIHSGYTGAGTYSAPSADAYVSASHHGHTWYAQFSSSNGASITVDGGGRSGSFAFTDQVDTKERVTGVFACG
jgi:hypothetical protein